LTCKKIKNQKTTRGEEGGNVFLFFRKENKMNAISLFEKHASKIFAAFTILFIICISLPVMWLFLVPLIIFAALVGSVCLSCKALSISRDSAKKLQADKRQIEENAIVSVISYLAPKTQAGMIRAGIDGYVCQNYPDSCWYTKDRRNMESILQGRPLQIPFVILRASAKKKLQAIAYLDPTLGSLARCEVECVANRLPEAVIPCNPLPVINDDKATVPDEIDARTPAVFNTAAKSWVEMNSQMLYTRMKDAVTSGNQFYSVKTSEITTDNSLREEIVRVLEAEFGEILRSEDTLLIPCQFPDAEAFDT